MAHMDLRSHRTMTEKGLDLYEHRISEFHRSLNQMCLIIDGNIPNIEKYKQNKTVLQEIRQILIEELQRYRNISDQLVEYLTQTKTNESDLEIRSHLVVKETVEEKVRLANDLIEQFSNDIDRQQDETSMGERHIIAASVDEASACSVKSENACDSNKHDKTNKSVHSAARSHSKRSGRSNRSIRTHSSHLSSNMSDILLQRKTKAEAAKAKLRIVEEEERLRKEQNELEIKVKKEQAEQQAMLEKHKSDLEASLNVLQCRREVVESEAELKVVEQFIQEEENDLPSETDSESARVKEYVESLPRNGDQINHTLPFNHDDRLKPDIPEFVPKDVNTQSNTIAHNSHMQNARPGVEDLTKYIMKKDLLMSRLSTFDDRPERYYTWKNSFLNIKNELDVTATEELDLLTRWLGPESKRQAVSIRASNSHDEKNAVKKIWERLDERFGAPEQVSGSLRSRLDNFPRISLTEKEKLYDLSDLLSEISSVKDNEKYKLSLSYFDSSLGVNYVINKLPVFIQNKWVDHASSYKVTNDVMYPPFQVFVEFVKKMAVRHNDHSFRFQQGDKVERAGRVKQFMPRDKPVYVKKTNLQSEKTLTDTKNQGCVVHGDGSKHKLKNCRTFHEKSISEKREIVKKNGICFKCLNGKHLAKDCKETIQCDKCHSARHFTTFHIERSESSSGHGGEHGTSEPPFQVETKCTEICGDALLRGKSCAKTILVRVYPEGNPDKAVKCYAIVDDQSNKSLARSELFDNISNNSEITEYVLSSCAGSVSKSGRRATGFVVESFDRSYRMRCPPLLEGNEIPDTKQEIATPAVARQYKHLREIEHLIPEIDKQASVLLLLGRDLLAAHHVLDQRIGTGNEPYAQCLRLGWVIVGETCLGKVHHSNGTDVVNVNKTNILFNGRSSIFLPCQNAFEITDAIFQRTAEDDNLGLSREDKEFLQVMGDEMTRSSSGHITAPLSFRKSRSKLPNNFGQAKHRAENLSRDLNRNPVKREHFLEFMKNIFEKNHAEEAPPAEEGEEIWYLPIFGVYNSKKPGKIRVVFDSSAKFNGVCLNDVLLKGPDLTNNLVAVLLNFRKERFAAMADVEQMFFNFGVHERHRNFLRFLWFKDNDPSLPLIEYRMRVHVFGNSPSPAVATYGIRKAVCGHDTDESCDEVCDYVKNSFYVDDGLVSKEKESELVDLIKNTQERLQQGGNIRLHKIVSNSSVVLSSFPSSDLAKNITEIDFSSETPYIQRSLGLSWNVVSDIFTYQVSSQRKPYTKRGLLSTINGLFDPLGFVAPVVLGGRLIMRKAIQDKNVGWDDPLPDSLLKDWTQWQDSLIHLEQIEIPRAFTELSYGNSKTLELHVFSDASKEAIAAVAYIRTRDPTGNAQVGFVLGKSKLAPSHGHTIPRLELCAAVVATEMASFIQKHLNVSSKSTYFYTDSQVVLGYINNESRRFYVYVANRVDRILNASSRSQWNFVPTISNPADHGTRPVNAEVLKDCKWLTGLAIRSKSIIASQQKQFDLVEPDEDKDVRPVVDVKKVEVTKPNLGSHRFERFSSWYRLVCAISCLKQKAALCHKTLELEITKSVDFRNDAEVEIIKEVQREFYVKDINCLHNGKPIPRDSNLVNLSPVLDTCGLLRVGGRLKNAKLETGEKTPIIIPGKHHIATLLVRHYHELVAHQGRHLTEGAIRTAGFWITGGKRLISSVLHKCVRCRKLRRPVEHQKMSDLPPCRLTPSPPFTYVGVDTFGPWSIVSRRTRGGLSNSKRWAILFSCLNTRSVHIEVVEDMSASSFINALRRFIAIRGPVKEFYSDRGKNFVGAVGEMGMDKVNVEDTDMKKFLRQHGTVWHFNAPHSSHMSGSWERMIGLSRRILDSMLCEHKLLTHEVLCTLMAEVMCIINSRPITTVSDDPSSPTVLSPNALLTQKLNLEIEPYQNLDMKNMYKSQWRQVQILADQFWKRWKIQYLQGLQTRRKWQTERSNLKTGDVVLMIDDSLPRIHWPVGIIETVFPSTDGLVRKVSVRIINEGKPVKYTRPITQLIHLLSE